ncbi:MAG: hypothetical protein M3N07_02475 [Pseudomonadota bacterium]|nr:hypothetical protein [Pseudomonadota bacterium]
MRIYGKFAWPPLPESDLPDWPPPSDEDPSWQSGYVELYRLDTPQGWIPCIRWVPKALSDAGQDVIDLLPPPHNLATADLRSALSAAGAPGAIAAFSLAVAPGIWRGRAGLRFRGAAVLEQFARGRGASAADEPRSRWLLARQFNSGRKHCWSEVLVGAGDDEPRRDGSSLTLSIALPTPAAQSVNERYASYAFPFRARYWPARPDGWGAEPLSVDTIQAGVANGVTSDAAQELKSVRPRLNAVHLGGFGFCRTDGGSEALYIPRRAGSGSDIDDPDRQRRARDAFWPSKTKRYFDDVIRKLTPIRAGFEERFTLCAPPMPGVDGRPEERTGGEARNSIYFDDDGDPKRTVIRFRSSLNANLTNNDHSGGDFAINGALSRRPLLELALPESPGTMLRTAAPDLLVELAIEYRLVDTKEVWAAVTAASSRTPGRTEAKVRVTLGVAGRVEAGTGQAALSTIGDEPGSPTVEDIFDRSVRAMRLARLDLSHVDASQPQSLLPDLRFENQTFRLAYCASFKAEFATLPHDQGVGDIARIDWQTTKQGDGSWPYARFRVTLWPPGGAPLPGEERRALEASLMLPSFAPSLPAQPVLIEHDAVAYRGQSERSALFTFALRPGLSRAAARKPEPARLGGLIFQPLIPILDNQEASRWSFNARQPLQLKATSRPRDSEWYWLCDLRISLRLLIARVTPIAIEPSRSGSQQAPVPLLIPLDSAAAGTNAQSAAFRLDAHEEVAPDRDRQLRASLLDLSPDARGRGDYVVLSEQPFAITRVRSQPLSDRGGQDLGIVAEYDSWKRDWTFKIVGPFYRYAFPPQSVGESMDKPRRLELHDPPSKSTPAGGVVRPYIDDGADGVLRHRAVQFRLTPSSEIWVQPGDVERAYELPEWATEKLWNGRGELGLGVALAGFRGEFLYGLSVGIDTSREAGPARTARVAEIGALLGQPPGPWDETATGTMGKEWNALRLAMRRRPERLEFWMRDPAATTPLAPGRFSTGVSFALRDTAVHAPALSGMKTGNASGPRIRDHGLMGGALWPIESRNFGDYIVEQPASKGGSIQHIALSPTGGDADQRAEFLGGQLAIISQTRNGHVQRHRIEIIGRISVFWHRAKHVVVYERTTNIPPQFAPAGDEGDQKRTRRPVLRKVSEYIELLQPERRFPDISSGPTDSAGFLRAVRFNSAIINVDSAWSEDLGGWGWRIPLWNRHAAEVSPQIYPRPDIAFVTASEGEEDEPVVAQDCLDPDFLYFFAEARTDTIDTDSWQPRVGVDYPNLPPPQHADQAEVIEPKGEGVRKAGAARIPRGHRAFTWRLAAAARRTTMNAERGEKPIYAGLETLTFARSTASQAQPEARDAVEKALEVAQNWHKSAFTEAGVRALTTMSNAELDRGARDLSRQLTNLRGKTEEGLQSLTAIAAGGEPNCRRMVDDFARSLQRKKLLVLDVVRSWLAEPAAEDFSDIGFPVPPRRDLVDKVVNRVMKEVSAALDPSFAAMESGIGGLEESLARARAIVRDLERDVQQHLTKSGRELDAAISSYDKSKPWSLSRIQEIDKMFATVRDGLRSDVRRAAADATGRLATDMNAIAQQLSRVVGEVLGKNVANLLETVDEGRTAPTRIRFVIDRGLKQLEDQGRAIKARVDAAQPQTAGDAAALAELSAALADTLQLIAVSRASLQAAQSAASQRMDLLADALSDAQARLKEIARTLEQHQARATAALEQLPDDLARLVGEGMDALYAGARPIMEQVQKLGAGIDEWVKTLRAELEAMLAAAQNLTATAFQEIDRNGNEARGLLAEVRARAKPEPIKKIIEDAVIRPAIETMVDGVDLRDLPLEEVRQELIRALRDAVQLIEHRLDQLDRHASSALDEVRNLAKTACDDLGSSLAAAREALERKLKDALGDNFEKATALAARIDAALGNAAALRALLQSAAADVDAVGAAFRGTLEQANAYADRVTEAAGNLTSGKLSAAPSNILRLYAAAASAPSLPNLDFARDRLGYYYGELNKVIDTTPAEAWFGRLGDELKALGLSVPVSRLGDRLLPDDLSNFDISRVFKNFGGLNLAGLFDQIKLPRGASDAIRVTHDFDKKQFRAWVQVDVDLPLPARTPLFTQGPFALDFVAGRMKGMVRLEASKDSDRVEQTGRASFVTDVDAVVGGQSVVTLRRVAIRYERNSGLKVEFDPKNIKLNPSFRFIQDTFGSIFPEEAGGLRIVKLGGIPVGVEHEFALPPLSLNFGTSGVSNIQIANRFSLVAYPDFSIANRFALSSPELPFLFSIFVIGGTGYMWVECQYRPFSKELMVIVEAAAGGSAALGFSAGPISGSVFITLSVAISYRKLIGSRRGGGLTVSVVLLIAGNVDVAGLANVYIGLLLRISYREDGRIDGEGTVSIRVRISRFFTYKVRRNVQRQLRGGSGRTQEAPAIQGRGAKILGARG